MGITDIAWLAGIMEGEGSIVFTGANSVVLSIAMTDKDVIDRIEKTVGAGKIYTSHRKGQKTIHQWQLQRKEIVVPLLGELLPWFGKRRTAKAEAALVRLENCRNSGECHRGHSMVGDNIYTSPSGRRMCRACMKIRSESKYLTRRRGRHPNNCDCPIHS